MIFRITTILLLFLSVPAVADERGALLEKCKFYQAENTALKMDNRISYSLKKLGWPEHYSDDLNPGNGQKDYEHHFAMIELFDIFLDLQREIIDLFILYAGSDGQVDKSEFTEIGQYIDEVFSVRNALVELEKNYKELRKKGFVKHKADAMEVPVRAVLSDLERYRPDADYSAFSSQRLIAQLESLKLENEKLFLEFKKYKESAIREIMKRQRARAHSHLIETISEKY